MTDNTKIDRNGKVDGRTTKTAAHRQDTGAEVAASSTLPDNLKTEKNGKQDMRVGKPVAHRQDSLVDGAASDSEIRGGKIERDSSISQRQQQDLVIMTVVTDKKFCGKVDGSVLEKASVPVAVQQEPPKQGNNVMKVINKLNIDNGKTENNPDVEKARSAFVQVRKDVPMQEFVNQQKIDSEALLQSSISPEGSLEKVNFKKADSESKVGNQATGSVESGVSKIKKQFENGSQVTSPILEAERASSQQNSTIDDLGAVSKTLESLGVQSTHVEDKIKKFNQASSNDNNSQTLTRPKRVNSFRNKEQIVQSDIDIGKGNWEDNNVNQRELIKRDSNNSIKPVPPKRYSCGEVKPKKMESDTHPIYLRNEKKFLDRTQSVDESTARHTLGRSMTSKQISFSSFKSSVSFGDYLSKEVRVPEVPTNETATTKSCLKTHNINSTIVEPSKLNKVNPPTILHSATSIVKMSPPPVAHHQTAASAKSNDSLTTSCPQPTNYISEAQLFKTCKAKSKDKCNTLSKQGHSSYFTRGSEEIWLIKKKDIEEIEDRVFKSFRKSNEAVQGIVKEQEKIDFLNRPVSTCKSIRRSPVPPVDAGNDAKQVKEANRSPRPETLQKFDQCYTGTETLARRSKKFFHFRSESLDPQSGKMMKQGEVMRSQTLKRQTSVSCTCGHDKKMRSKSQGEPTSSVRAPYQQEDLRDLQQKQKLRSRSQGAVEEGQPKSAKVDAAQRSSEGNGDKGTMKRCDIYDAYESRQHPVPQDEDLFEKYETLV